MDEVGEPVTEALALADADDAAGLLDGAAALDAGALVAAAVEEAGAAAAVATQEHTARAADDTARPVTAPHALMTHSSASVWIDAACELLHGQAKSPGLQPTADSADAKQEVCFGGVSARGIETGRSPAESAGPIQLTPQAGMAAATDEH